MDATARTTQGGIRMNDLISRSWLLDVFELVPWDTDKDRNRAIHHVRELAPSVQLDQSEYFDNLWQKAYELGEAAAQPERIKGRWIKISPAGIYECSVCGQNVMTDDIDVYHYCHGCGADMREQDDSDRH